MVTTKLSHFSDWFKNMTSHGLTHYMLNWIKLRNSYYCTKLIWNHWHSPSRKPRACSTYIVNIMPADVLARRQDISMPDITLDYRECSIPSSTWVNPKTPGNAWVCSQHCGYWCPGAKAPSHQYPQCWLNIHCIGQASYKNITLMLENIRK